VELIVAMLLLSVGLFSVLGTSGSVSKSLGGGMRQTLAASVAQARIDSLTSIGCQALTPSGVTSSGSGSVRGVYESWSVVDGRNVKSISVEVTIPGRSNPIVYETIIPCRD
jgi:hypothetical protein